MDEKRQILRNYRGYESRFKMNNRYLLNTNILVFMVTGEIDEISPDVGLIFEDYNSQLETSSVSI